MEFRFSLVLLGDRIDWEFLDSRFRTVCLPGPGQPGLPTRLVAGLFILKHMHSLSDEVLCARWLENRKHQVNTAGCPIRCKRCADTLVDPEHLFPV